MKRRTQWKIERLVLYPLAVAFVWSRRHWREASAAVGGVALLAGISGLIAMDIELYADYAAALQRMAVCWLMIVCGGSLVSLLSEERSDTHA